MDGFSEKGEPGSWDMAVGTVRGFRWWTLTVPFVPTAYRRPFRHFGYWADRDFFYPPSHDWSTGFERYAPDLVRAGITGMHSGAWYRDGRDDKDRYHAFCACLAELPALRATLGLNPHIHSDYIPDPGCGCGFWAYWDGLSYDFELAFPQVRKSSRYGLEVNVPLGGIIEGSGRTIVGTRGFRSQFAKITDLALDFDGYCLFTDEDSEPSTEYRYSVNSPVGKFLPFLSRETGIEPETIRAAVTRTVTEILGDKFRMYTSLSDLTENAPRDENYGTK